MKKADDVTTDKIKTDTIMDNRINRLDKEFFNTYCTPEAKSQLLSDLMEIIGEDEALGEYPEQNDLEYWQEVGKNGLRQQLREELKQYFS